MSVRDYVFRCPNEIETAAAAWLLGLLRSQDLPQFAAIALSSGVDNEAVRTLAGLSDPGFDEAETLMKKTVAAVGLGSLDRRSAALILAKCIAALILNGQVAAYEGAKQIWDVAKLLDEASFHDLDPFIYAASEYEDRPNDRSFFDDAIINEARRLVAY